MSKKIEVQITCPSCSDKFDFQLYRTIWGENQENRNLVMSDQINIATCPSCSNSVKIPSSLMYTNVDEHFAVWWEPENDPQIDEEIESYIKYAKRLKVDLSYLSTAPRVKGWEDFKEAIRRFEQDI